MSDEHATPPEPEGPAKRRLGRGLNALLGSRRDDGSGEPEPDGGPPPELQQIDVSLIDRNPFQPRAELGEESLASLVASVRQHGVLQPVLVRAHGGRFQLIAGERRWLAAREAGLQSVPCRVIERDDRASSEAALEENLKRKDLNPLEKAQAFQDYRERFGCSLEELAEKLSMNRATVSNFLRLLELPEPVKQSLRADKISNGHARALLSLERPEDQSELCRRIERRALSVRATEAEVRKLLKGPDTVPFPGGGEDDERPAAPEPTSHLRSLQEQLRGQLGVRVEIKQKGKESGRIVIHFDSNDDFERIVRQLRRDAA